MPYSKEALRQDLLRVRNAWEDCQASRDRNAIYGYLGAVFDLVMWWAAENRAISRARWALRLHGLDLPTIDEPFAMVILCTADRAKVDKRTRSKWSRVMRYAAEYKLCSEPLDHDLDPLLCKCRKGRLGTTTFSPSPKATVNRSTHLLIPPFR